MNRYQRKILTHFILVVVVTLAAVVGMYNVKDIINRSEAMRAMEQLGEVIFRYRRENGTVPPASYVENIRPQLDGAVRLGELIYRARWIEYNCPDYEILAYTRKNYRSLVANPGYIVLRMDGTVEWVEPKVFEEQLQQQQSPLERQLSQ